MVDQTTEKVQLGDVELCVHFWNKSKNKPNDSSLFVVYHGFGAHGLYPTVRLAAELVAQANDSYTIVAADMRGHGQSPGVNGLIPSTNVLLDDALRVLDYAMEEFQPKKSFVMGSSMGGTISLLVAQERPDKVAGVVLLAPMLKLAVSGLEQTLLSGLASVIPSWKVIPSSSKDSAKQYRDEAIRKEIDNDEYTPKGKNMHVGSANVCVQLANSVQFAEVEVPFLVMVADEDVVVDKQGSYDLYEKAKSSDKTLKNYPALHGLLCEPKPLIDDISKDMLDWIRERV